MIQKINLKWKCVASKNYKYIVVSLWTKLRWFLNVQSKSLLKFNALIYFATVGLICFNYGCRQSPLGYAVYAYNLLSLLLVFLFIT